MAKPKTATRNQGRATGVKSKLSPAQAAKIRATANRLLGK